jgi:hypothetical protein
VLRHRAGQLPGRADGSYFDWCAKANTSCQTGAVAGDPWNFDKCVQDNTHLTTVCVVYDGDQVFVYDGDADGHSALGIVFSDAGSVTERYCRNTHGYMTWAKCDFDWVEDTRKTVYGGIRYDNDSHWWVTMWSFNNN